MPALGLSPNVVNGSSVASFCRSFIWIYQGVHKYLDIAPQKPGTSPSKRGQWIGALSGHHPIRSTGGYSHGPGLNASFRFRCPALSTTRPLVLPCILTNELLNSLQERTRRRNSFSRICLRVAFFFGDRSVILVLLKSWADSRQP